VKKYIYIILFFYTGSLYSFPTDGGRSADLNINTQEELDNLQYTEEVGNLIIASEGVDQIVDLSNLKSIKHVKGSIYVINNNELSDLDGISVFVDGDIIIIRNKSLERLTSNFVKGNVRDIHIKNNKLLKNIVGLDKIESINSISVESNNSLVDLNGLSSLKEISGDVTISNNDELKYFHPFVDVVYFNGKLKVNNNKSLFDADGLYKLQSMASTSELKNNTIYTTDLELMKVIYEGKGKLKFKSQQDLDLFGECYKKKSFKGDIIIDKSSITNIDALKCLKEIDGRLIIKRNDNLVSIDGLCQLVSINNLIISFNKNLESLSGLENLSTVKNNVVIYRNTYLTDTSSISDDISLGGKLVIKSNPRLDK